MLEARAAICARRLTLFVSGQIFWDATRLGLVEKDSLLRLCPADTNQHVIAILAVEDVSGFRLESDE